MDRNSLLKHVNQYVTLTKDEGELFLSYFQETKIRKRQFIVQPNFVAQHRNYVLEGALRAYIVCYQGQDHTIQFAVEDWWITDYNSYIFQKPASLFVIALEDCTLLRIGYEDEQKLIAAHPKFETYFRKMAERSSAYMQLRIISNLTDNAEQRYLKFTETYPEIAYRVPQYALASFLGMTTEYLSRLRNKRTSQKS